jgi:hypothetical protein
MSLSIKSTCCKVRCCLRVQAQKGATFFPGWRVGVDTGLVSLSAILSIGSSSPVPRLSDFRWQATLSLRLPKWVRVPAVSHQSFSSCSSQLLFLRGAPVLPVTAITRLLHVSTSFALPQELGPGLLACCTEVAFGVPIICCATCEVCAVHHSAASVESPMSCPVQSKRAPRVPCMPY